MDSRYLVAYSVYGASNTDGIIEFSDSMMIMEEDLDIENDFVNLKENCLYDITEKYDDIPNDVKIKILAITDLKELSFNRYKFGGNNDCQTCNR